MNEEKFCVETFLDEKGFKALYKFNAFSDKKKLFFIMILVVVMFFSGVYNLINHILLFGLIFIGFSIFYPIIHYYFSNKSFKKAIASQNFENPIFYYSVEISEKGVKIQNESGIIYIKWSEIKKVTFEEEYFFISLFKKQNFILPLKNKKEIEIENLHNLINTHFKK